MDYIYAAVFSDLNVKFGRSVDLWRRLYKLDNESKNRGEFMTNAFISTVSDGVQCERDILRHASMVLTKHSNEGFKIDSIKDVSDVFFNARMPFLLCDMDTSKFSPMITTNSFSPNIDVTIANKFFVPKHREGRIKGRINTVISTYSGSVTDAIIKNRLSHYPYDEVLAILNEMMEEGVIIAEKYIHGSNQNTRYKIADN